MEDKKIEIVKSLLKGEEINSEDIELLSNITITEFYLFINTLFSQVTNTTEESQIMKYQIKDIIDYHEQNVDVELVTDVQKTTLVNQLLDRLIKGQKLEKNELMLLSNVSLDDLLGIVDLYMFKQFALKNKERYLIFYNNLERIKISRKKIMEERGYHHGI